MSTPPERPTKRARSTVACRRCKHRKQRCDNTFPACAACVSAGETCSYDTKVHPPEYVESLERRVADLEHSLARQARDASNLPASATLGSRSVSHGQNNEMACSPSSCGRAADTGFDMLSPGSAFLGTSSGYPLAQTVHAVIASASAKPSRTQQDFLITPAVAEAGIPGDALGKHLVQTYLAKVHPKHPFLSPRHILHLHELRENLRKTTPERPLISKLHSFQLCMVYAIGARYHQISQNEYQCSPDAYYAAAMEDFGSLFKGTSLETLEGMLLLALFQLRSSRPAEIWTMVGMTMRHSISLGLHRKFTGSHVVDQRRKRLFWTIYMLEQSIARTMGRPMSISNRDIDVDLPANVDENIDSEHDMDIALQQDRGPTTMSAIIHIFRLTQLESKIYSSVHRVDRPVPNESKTLRLRHLLDDWKNHIPDHAPDCSVDDGERGELVHYYSDSTYHVLHYHLALLLLLLPRLTSLPSTHDDFKTCLTSAGQVCQLYKRLHSRQTILAYSIIALHATFVAGLTLIYCFITDPAILNMQLNSDIRACSNVLLLISERWPAARRVRDAFERMLSRTVENPDLFSERQQEASMENFNGLTSALTDGENLDSLWAEIMADQSASSSDVFTDCRDDIWKALGPWFDTQ